MSIIVLCHLTSLNENQAASNKLYINTIYEELINKKIFTKVYETKSIHDTEHKNAQYIDTQVNRLEKSTEKFLPKKFIIPWSHTLHICRIPEKIQNVM